jgi:ABC-type uncharacterized transport system permease subunit
VRSARLATMTTKRCPNCGTEYESWATVCTECDQALIDAPHRAGGPPVSATNLEPTSLRPVANQLRRTGRMLQVVGVLGALVWLGLTALEVNELLLSSTSFLGRSSELAVVSLLSSSIYLLLGALCFGLGAALVAASVWSQGRTVLVPDGWSDPTPTR